MHSEQEDWNKGAKKSTHREILSLPDIATIEHMRQTFDRIFIPLLASISEAATISEVIDNEPGKVVVLGPGTCEEFAYFRDMYPKAQITGLDIMTPDQYIKFNPLPINIADTYNVRLLW